MIAYDARIYQGQSDLYPYFIDIDITAPQAMAGQHFALGGTSIHDAITHAESLVRATYGHPIGARCIIYDIPLREMVGAETDPLPAA